MKKSKLFSFVFLVAAIMLSYDVPAQDAQINIGKAHIRYDADSNMLRIGSPSGNMKLAREQNVALFNYNPLHFEWSTSTGLNLKDISNHDSLWSYRYTVMKDTGDGEISPYKSRNYTLKKPSWYNGFNAFDLMWYYRSFSSGILDYYDSAHAINSSGLLTTLSDLKLNTTYGLLYEVVLPVQGEYILYVNFDYEFGDDKPATVVTDVIDMRLIQFHAIQSTSISFTYPGSVAIVGSRGNGSMVIPLYSSGPGESFMLQGQASANSSSDKYIRKLSVTYLLVK